MVLYAVLLLLRSKDRAFAVLLVLTAEARSFWAHLRLRPRV